MTAGPYYFWIDNQVVFVTDSPADMKLEEAKKYDGQLCLDTTPSPDNYFMPCNDWLVLTVCKNVHPWVLWNAVTVHPNDVPPEFKLQLTLLGVPL